MAKPARGFTMLEFCIVTAVVAALSATLLLRFGEMRRDAESTAARQVLAALEAALRVRVTRAGGDPAVLARLARDNPIHWLIKPPANYGGEMDALDPDALPGNTWVFIRRDKTLVYLPSIRESLAFPTSRLLRFKVEFAHSPTPSGPTIAMAGMYEAGHSAVQALAGH